MEKNPPKLKTLRRILFVYGYFGTAYGIYTVFIFLRLVMGQTDIRHGCRSCVGMISDVCCARRIVIIAV